MEPWSACIMQQVISLIMAFILSLLFVNSQAGPKYLVGGIWPAGLSLVTPDLEQMSLNFSV